MGGGKEDAFYLLGIGIDPKSSGTVRLRAMSLTLTAQIRRRSFPGGGSVRLFVRPSVVGSMAPPQNPRHQQQVANK